MAAPERITPPGGWSGAARPLNLRRMNGQDLRLIVSPTRGRGER
jgi:hypothetical protein